MKQILINADDFGYDIDTLTTTIGLMERGVVRSATVLVGFPATELALAFARENMASHSFGLHFNIAEGRPVSNRPVPSLVNRAGDFHGAVSQRLRAVAGMLDPKDIATEAEAQLSAMADYGVRMTHIDSHGHFHKFPKVLSALEPVLKRFSIQRVRRPQTLYDNPRFYNRALDTYCNWNFDKWARCSDNFFNTRSDSSEWLRHILTHLPNGTTEIGIHPGMQEEWRRRETQPFLDNGISEWIERQNISIISYNDIDI